MKEVLNDINKAFENKVRLAIMSSLIVNDSLDFNKLKSLLDVTDGNLASHLKALEKMECINIFKEFINRKPHTKYLATQKGKEAFMKHIKAIEQLLK